MQALLRLSRLIDRVSTAIGHLVMWMCLGMILLGAFNALARYLGRFAGTNLASNAYIEGQWYLFSLVFLLGAATTLRRDAHVRVDLLYGRLGRRGRAWIDLAGTAIFLVPFCIFTIAMSLPSVRASWAVLEGSPDPGGLPRYPIKTAVIVAFALLLLQALSEAIKRVAILLGAGPEEAADGG